MKLNTRGWGYVVAAALVVLLWGLAVYQHSRPVTKPAAKAPAVVSGQFDPGMPTLTTGMTYLKVCLMDCPKPGKSGGPYVERLANLAAKNKLALHYQDPAAKQGIFQPIPLTPEVIRSWRSGKVDSRAVFTGCCVWEFSVDDGVNWVEWNPLLNPNGLKMVRKRCGSTIVSGPRPPQAP